MEFNLTRFGALVKRDFIIYKKQVLLLMFSSVLAVAAIWYFTNRTYEQEENLLEYWMSWYLIFLAFGLLITAFIFREFKSPFGRMQYLSIPASHLEKLVSRWSYSLILYPIFITIVLFGFAFTEVDTGHRDYADNIQFGKYLIHAFILAHAIQLIYAIIINKNVAFKSFILSIASFIVTLLIAGAIFYLVFHEYIPIGGLKVGPDMNLRLTPEAMELFSQRLPKIGLFIGKFILPPYLWIVAYFKLKEKEV